MVSAVVKANLSDGIIEYIKNKIIKMSYKPGERIVESKIASELSVSHSPIREALRVLEKNRLVEHIPRKGVYVTELVESNIESLFEIMTELLVLVAKKTIRNAKDIEIEEATRIVNKIIAAAKINDIEEYYNNVITFGIFCLTITSDMLLEQIIYELLPGIQRILYLSFASHEETLTEGAALLKNGTQAIRKKDSGEAELLLRRWLAHEMSNAIKGLKDGNLLN